MPTTAPHTPTAAEIELWLPGAVTVTQATERFGLSRDELFAAMHEGALRFKVKDERGTRLIAVLDLATYVASLPDRLPEPRRRPPVKGKK